MTLWNESDMGQLGKARAHALPAEPTACRREQQADPSCSKLPPIFEAWGTTGERKLRHRIWEFSPGPRTHTSVFKLRWHLWSPVPSMSCSKKHFSNLKCENQVLGNEVFKVEFQPTHGKIQRSHPKGKTDTEGAGIYFASECKEATWEVQMTGMAGDGWRSSYKLQDNLGNSIRQYKKSYPHPHLNAWLLTPSKCNSSR